jgi:hypothetical protein
MEKKIKKKHETLEGLLHALTESVQIQTIVYLGLSGIPQQTIRKIVGVDMKRVTKIVKHLNKGQSLRKM